jgi:hypothetical protein
MATQPNLATLANEELTSIGENKMVRVKAIARLDALIKPLG